MSSRERAGLAHHTRRLSDGRWVCGAKGCTFTSREVTEATRHALECERKP